MTTEAGVPGAGWMAAVRYAHLAQLSPDALDPLALGKDFFAWEAVVKGHLFGEVHAPIGAL